MVGIGADAIGRPIDQFRVSGNVKTQRKYILQWSELNVGQILTIPVLNNALQDRSCAIPIYSGPSVFRPKASKMEN